MMRGINMLEADEQTKVMVLISKPPAPATMARVLGAANKCTKPVVVSFLGAEISPTMLGNLIKVDTLDEAAAAACELSSSNPVAGVEPLSAESVNVALAENAKLGAGQRYVRGLFAGGTFCYESQRLLKPLLGQIFSNAPIKPEDQLPGDEPSKGHTCIDMGADEFVEGRAHPMMDFSLRNLRILQEARDPETAVILIDLELGYGSNPDPAGQLAPTVMRAIGIAKDAGRHLAFVASVVGTEGDFQGLSSQEKALSDAGVLILPSNAQATRVSALIAAGEGVKAAILGRQS